MRWPTPATLLSRPGFLLYLVPCLILVHLSFKSSSLSSNGNANGPRLRSGAIDERVGWQGDSTWSVHEESLGMKAGAAISGLGQRLGVGGGGARGSATRQGGPGPGVGDRKTRTRDDPSFASSFFKRTGGSLYELVSITPSFLYDARSSLDKLRLTSTRFVSSTPPAPTAVFSNVDERQHILVTGGFSSLGKALVRDLLLLGGENGDSDELTNESKKTKKKGSPPLAARGLRSWWGKEDDFDDERGFPSSSLVGSDGGIGGALRSEKKIGLVVTIVDVHNKSAELDDMLKHPPLYHRSRVGFNLPIASNSMMDDDPFAPDSAKSQKGKGKPDSIAGAGTPPLEFIDPRSAAFSSSEVSLASFIQKGRLRIILGDSRNATLLSSLLDPTSANPNAEPSAADKHTAAKTKFGFKKRPHRVMDEELVLPPVSGVYHLDGYENSQCITENPRDCADKEVGGIESLANALKAIEESVRPWVVVGNRGNLDHEKVATWLHHQDGNAQEQEPSIILSASTQLPQAMPPAHKKRQEKRSKGSLAASAYSATHSSSHLGPLFNVAKHSKVHGLSLRVPPEAHIFGDSFASRSLPIPALVHSAIGHLPIVIDEDSFPYMQVSSMVDPTNPEQNMVEPPSRHDPFSQAWQRTGVVYIDDLVETFVAAGELLSRSNSAEYLDRMSLLAEIEVLPPPHRPTGPSKRTSFNPDSPDIVETGLKSVAEETLDWIVQLTKSSSPVGYMRRPSDVDNGSTDPPNEAQVLTAMASQKPLDRSLANRVLGTTPSTPLPLALKAYIRSLLGRQTSHLVDKINKACAAPPDLRTLNDALAQLDTCSVQLLGMIQSENTVLACNPEYLNSSLVPPLVLSPAVPYTEAISQVKLKSRWGPVGKVELGFFCPFGANGKEERIVWLENAETLVGKWSTLTEAQKMAQNDPAIWVFESFEVSFVHRDTRSFLLSIPNYSQAERGAPKRRMVYAFDRSVKASPEVTLNDKVILDWQLLAETGEQYQNMEWRINPLLCEKKEVKEFKGFTFLREDPIYTSQILYPSSDGSTTVAESTYELQKCRDLRAAHEYSRKLNIWNEQTNTARTCDKPMSEGSDWFIHDLPTCSIDCDAPITCLVTDKCRCARDRCPATHSVAGVQISPAVEAVQFESQLSYRTDGKGPHSSLAEAKHALALRDQVDNLPWDVVIQPLARQAFSFPVSALPRGHIVQLDSSIDTHLSNEACYDLAKAEVPTTGDHLIVKALEERNAALEDADFALIPFYQGCYYNYLKENTYKKLADSVAQAETQIVLSHRLRASNIVIPFSHDWGSCTGWWSHMEDVLSRTPPPPMSKATSWQVNSDLNTRCIKAERDVVMPAVTKNGPLLLEKYSDLNSVTPSDKRKHLAFFSGDVKGYGAFARTRLAHKLRAGDQNADILYQAHAKDSDYIGTLGQSRFCLLPRGIAGWSTRAFDAIYAGCIPVFISDRTTYPFQSILSYSTFSISIRENDIHNMETILRSIPERQITLMQLALLKVRDAFIFLDDPTKEWSRRGPLYYILLDMAMKVSLEWPTLPVHNYCRK